MPASQKVRPISKSPVAGRIARYVNTTFGGNLTHAAKEIGCDYGALHRAANGLTIKPNVALLTKLAGHSGKTLDWWINGDTP